ncbi:hypothetical protein CHUAL_009681 [Chamberlinius hualienensis]
MGWLSVLFAYGFPMGDDHSKNTMSNAIASERKTRSVNTLQDEESTVDQGPPRFLYIRSSPPRNLEVQLQSKLVLECEAAGSPAPSIHWLKGGHRISQDSFLLTNDLPDVEGYSQGLSTTKSRLYIDCISPSDEGDYTCVATTPYQRISVDTHLYLSAELPTVLKPCLPQKKSLSHPSGEDFPKIHMWSTRLLQNIGTDAILFCRVSGTPAPTVKWTVNDEAVIRNNDRYHILRSGDLMIRHIVWNDMGEYRCTASNGNGADDSVTTFLYPMANEDVR